MRFEWDAINYASRRTFYLTYLAYMAYLAYLAYLTRDETNGHARRDDQQSQGSIKGVGYVGRSFCFSSGPILSLLPAIAHPFSNS